MVTKKKEEQIVLELRRLNNNLEKIASLLEELVVAYKRLNRKKLLRALAEERP